MQVGFEVIEEGCQQGAKLIEDPQLSQFLEHVGRWYWVEFNASLPELLFKFRQQNSVCFLVAVGFDQLRLFLPVQVALPPHPFQILTCIYEWRWPLLLVEAKMLNINLGLQNGKIRLILSLGRGDGLNSVRAFILVFDPIQEKKVGNF